MSSRFSSRNNLQQYLSQENDDDVKLLANQSKNSLGIRTLRFTTTKNPKLNQFQLQEKE